jgi:hypothetical protein
MNTLTASWSASVGVKVAGFAGGYSVAVDLPQAIFTRLASSGERLSTRIRTASIFGLLASSTGLIPI